MNYKISLYNCLRGIRHVVGNSGAPERGEFQVGILDHAPPENGKLGCGVRCRSGGGLRDVENPDEEENYGELVLSGLNYGSLSQALPWQLQLGWQDK